MSPVQVGEEKKTRRKYVEVREIYVFDSDRGLIVKGPGIVWQSVKPYLKRVKNGKYKAKMILLQIPKKLEQYDKLTVIIVPRDEAEK